VSAARAGPSEKSFCQRIETDADCCQPIFLRLDAVLNSQTILKPDIRTAQLSREPCAIRGNSFPGTR